ncbi:beta-ketoacyl synthase N-terminal-like domain-containing protein [Neotamlana laminarinivorans]|uniref:Beta-ketoacyl synthase chain length factor n=1 Tax=Neotamlana laminarinivorans TaxID=2883124 RepID=A0A9X1L275_9FLAO|nr:beta-ketoacyl synthase N-terminal-like domain-containing protein [Tamlana laminarinivorans]MCB4799500.1 beta-ketoacyl synthase chain length factor [Tamlana laminarinivorans]
MEKVYINGLGSISAQNTFDNSEFLNTVEFYTENVIPAIDVNYKAFISPAAARRMAKGIKMGIAASRTALQEANLENVDAIITGTGMGCVRDSEKFLSAILDNDEQYLTPTPFIQSTHNTVGGQIALDIGCKGYNFTYVHASVSFESALLDALLQLKLKESHSILIGGVDELAPHTIEIHKAVNHIKSEVVEASKLLENKSKGAVFSEGANFFVISNEKSETSYAEVVGVKLINTLEADELETELKAFLKEQNLSMQDLSTVVLGCNGDVEFDGFYDVLVENSLKDTPQLYYKHLSGEFHTASSFGFWLAARVLKSQTIPKAVVLKGDMPSEIKNVLLYNQYRGQNHSFTLLKSC